jgi:hypothetical protein
VEVPGRPHDTAREVKLDVVDAVLDLLADGFHSTIGEPVNRVLEIDLDGDEVTLTLYDLPSA